MDDEAFTLARAARIVRKGMVNMTAQFNGTFPENCQVEAVPQFLVTLVAMLLYGANIKEQSLVTQTQALLSICQILMFNSSAHNPKQTDRNVTANLVSLLCLCIWVSFFTTRQGKENWLKNFSSWAYQFRMTEFSKYPQIKGPRFAIVMISWTPCAHRNWKGVCSLHLQWTTSITKQVPQQQIIHLMGQGFQSSSTLTPTIPLCFSPSSPLTSLIPISVSQPAGGGRACQGCQFHIHKCHLWHNASCLALFLR